MRVRKTHVCGVLGISWKKVISVTYSPIPVKRKITVILISMRKKPLSFLGSKKNEKKKSDQNLVDRMISQTVYLTGCRCWHFYLRFADFTITFLWFVDIGYFQILWIRYDEAIDRHTLDQSTLTSTLGPAPHPSPRFDFGLSLLTPRGFKK